VDPIVIYVQLTPTDWDALQHYTFRNAPAAYRQACTEIADREKQEQLTPSNPQMWVGASMSKKLGKPGPLPLG
jgi:hypothetical protein